jgi:hypothetical protein
MPARVVAADAAAAAAAEWAWFSSRRSLKPWRWSRVPLNSIREYFGEEIALYYAWLLEYTHALIYPAIIGVACSCTQWGPFLFHENGGYAQLAACLGASAQAPPDHAR